MDWPKNANVVIHCRNDPCRYPHGDCDEQGGSHELDRRGKPLDQRLKNGLGVARRVPHVADQNVPEPLEVLDRNRLIESKIVFETRDIGRRDMRIL